MEKQIALLKGKYGTYKAVAEFLDITERYLMEMVAGRKPSSALAYRIRIEAEKLGKKHSN
jgi:hypothetical protein